jgi:hypothetical protein
MWRNLSKPGGRVRRRRDQVRSSYADGGAGRAGAGAPAQFPLTLVVTLGGLPGPCETISVVRVQVTPPLLVVTTLTLLAPGGRLP